MKIAINGEIIDTYNIWKISDIDANSYMFEFIIHLFNGNDLCINKTCGAYYGLFEEKWMVYIGEVEDVVFNTKEEALAYYKNLDTYKNTLKQITDFRQSIIDVWSDNQSNIPQFDLI